MKAEDALLILTLLRESGYWPHLLAWRDAAVAAEREAIATHFERDANADFDFLGRDVAAYVRARGKT